MPGNGHSGKWSDIEEVGVYWLMRFSLWLRMLLGAAVFRAVLFPVVIYYFLANKKSRDASLDYLKHIQRYAPESDIRSNFFFGFRHFLSFGQSIVDKLAAWNGDIKEEDVVIHGRERFYSCLGKNQGALILGSHLGNTEISRVLAGIHGQVKLNILVHTKHARNFNRLLESVSRNDQMQLIQVTELTPAIAILLDQKVAQGEFVFIVGDRVPVNSGRTLVTRFLGDDAHFAQGPFILASLLKCPVYTLFCLRQNKKYHVYFEFFSDRVLLPRKNRLPVLQKNIDAFAARLEKYCLLAPLQWFNFYDYWVKSSDSQ